MSLNIVERHVFSVEKVEERITKKNKEEKKTTEKIFQQLAVSIKKYIQMLIIFIILDTKKKESNTF